MRTRGLALMLTLATTAAPAQEPPAARPAVPRVHDPALIEEKGRFTLFGTGRGVPMLTSTDLVRWERAGAAFPDGLPAWAREAIPRVRDCWAPDISRWGDEYRLYYSVSTFGSQRSAIGLAVNKALDPADPAYRWEDRGMVLDSAPGRDDFNAIDPNVVVDPTGPSPRLWLSWGSFWGGLKILELDPATGKPFAGRKEQPKTIARRDGDHAIEAPFVFFRDGWFYLFVSVDHCCRGAWSDYNVVVGRSRRVDGPYLDLAGRSMAEGGGSPVIAGFGPVRGPGHNAALRRADGSDLFVHHYYDADDRGTPHVQVRRLVWGPDGFPLPGEVVAGAGPDPEVPAAEVARLLKAGRWSYSSGFADFETIRLCDDGRVEADGRPGGSWTLAGRVLRIDWGGGKADECLVAADGRSFVGRNPAHEVIRGSARPE